MLSDRPDNLRSPELRPLVVGSPVACAIHDIWVGNHSVEFFVADPTERLEAACMVAAYLASRALIRVNLRLAAVEDVAAAAERLPDLLPLNQVARFGLAVERAAPNLDWKLTDYGVIVSYGLDGAITMNSPLTHQICVAPASRSRPPAPAKGRRVNIPASADDFEFQAQARLRLGDAPLDLIVAGYLDGPDA